MPGLGDVVVPQADYDQYQDEQSTRSMTDWADGVAQADQMHAWAGDVAAQDQQAATQQAAQRAATQAAARTYDQATDGLDQMTAWADQLAAKDRAPAPSSGTTDVGGTDWRAYAAQAAQKAGIDPALFQRQIQQESGFDPNAKSGAGALGIAQIVPSAHPGVDPLDPKAALDYAATWMRSLVDRYGGDVRKALAAYNAGPGAVDKYGGVPPFEETQRYVKTIYDDAGGPSGGGTAQTMPTDAPPTPGQDAAQFGAARGPSRVEALGQFEQGLPYDEAAAICGPVAAVAFAQANGRNPDLGEARRLAAQVGWTAQGGMNGVANEQKLLTAMGVASRLDTNPDFGHIAQDAASGNPVIISTDRHYYYASAYDPDTGKLYVGKTGTSRKGGGSWMTPQEIATLDGGINGALFVDNPQSPTPSVGASADDGVDTSGDRPPSEFETPSQFQGDRYLGRRPDAPIAMGDVGEPTIAAGLPRTSLAALDYGANAVEAQIARSNAADRGALDTSGEYLRAVQHGGTASPDLEARAWEAPQNLAMSLSGEPLAAASTAGRAALGLERAAMAERQPGMSIGPVSRYEPDPSDFAAFMESRRGFPANPAPTRRSPMGLRAYEAHLREQAARDLEPAGPALGQAVDPQAGRDKGDWESLLRSMDEQEPAGTLGVLGDLPRAGVPTAREIPPELGPVVEQGRLGPRPTPPTPEQIPPELGPVVEQGRLEGPRTPPPPLPPGGTVGRQRSLFPNGEDPTSAPTSSRLFSRSWNRIRNVIESQGEAGKQLGQGLRDWRDGAERLTGEWVSAMPTVRKLDAGQFDEFVRAAEGEATPSNPTVAKALEEWQNVRQDVYDRAKAAGLEIGYRDDYFPHMFEPGTFRGKGFADAVTHLVQSGQAASREEAAADLRRVLAWRNRRYGNLEAERAIDVPFYRRDKGVLFGQGGYLEGAANRISQVATFGQKDAGAMALIDKIDQEKGTGDVVRGLFDAAVGARRDDPAAAAISRGLRRVNTVASLGLSAITNAGQSVNTATVAGFGPTARAAWKYLTSPAAREDVVRAGVNLENVVADLREAAGAGGAANKVLNAITAPGFGLVERFNRGVAYHAGGDVAESLLTRAMDGTGRGAQQAAAELERLGLNPGTLIERGHLTDADKITAGRRLVERAQFKVDPQDLPVWATTPAGKVVFQFKNFSYNQSAFMGREIIQPALRGDVGPLTRFLIAGLLAGAATTETRNALQGRQPEQDPAKRILQYYNAVGGLGLVGDVARIATPLVNINADRLPEDRIASQALGTLLGPTVGTAAELITAGAHARQPFGTPEGEAGRYVPLERAVLRRIPVVGTTLQNLLVPYKGPTTTSGGSGGSTRSSSGPPKPPSPPKPPAPPRPGKR